MSASSSAPPAPAAERLAVRSETGALELALVHEPGAEVERLGPGERARFGYAGLPHRRGMAREHRALVAALRDAGTRVLRLDDLLADVLRDERALRRLVRAVCEAALQPALAPLLLDHLDAEEVRRVLLAGVTAGELEGRTGWRLGSAGADPFLLPPLPNACFVRDVAAVVGEGIVAARMHARSRLGESVVLREVLRGHPAFRGAPFLFGDGDPYDRPFSLEGGDVLVLGRRAVLVGRGPRTRGESARLLARRLFAAGAAEVVYEVPVPRGRGGAHLDGALAVVDDGTVLSLPGYPGAGAETVRYDPQAVRTEAGDVVVAVPARETRPLHKVLEEELGRLPVTVLVGGGDPRHAAREGPGCAAAVLALSPGRVLAYDRNERTNRALRRHGIEVVEVAGAELVRGRGGPRSLVLPLRRAG